MGYIALVVSAYKFLAVTRIGKTIFPAPPCNGASWVHIIEMICISISFYIVLVNKPTDEGVMKGDAIRSEFGSMKKFFRSTASGTTGSSRRSSSSIAPGSSVFPSKDKSSTGETTRSSPPTSSVSALESTVEETV